MNTTGIESVLSRAMSDSAFAEQLFSNVEQALIGFELTAEEITSLKSMSRADFAAMTQQPEERKSFGVKMNHNQSALKI